MTIVRVNTIGWGVGEKVTSAQLNAVDINATYALDKRAGQTDTLASVVQLSGAGRLIPAMVVGADANTTYLISGGNGVIRVTNAVTASRTYTLGATDAQSSDSIVMYCESTFSSAFEIVVKDQSNNTIFILGNADSADGQWAEFIYAAGGWRLFKSNSARNRVQTFTANGTFVAPRGVTFAKYLAVGGGGGAGGGAGADTTSTAESSTGGGGGGGALLAQGKVTLTPLANHTVVIGTGGTAGAGGAANTVGSDGNDGGDTTFDAVVIASGGAKGSGGYLNAGANTFCPGGAARKGMPWPANNTTAHPGSGGGGRGGAVSGGGASPQAYNGSGTAVSNGGTGALGGSLSVGGSAGGGGGGGGGSGWVGGHGGGGGSGGNAFGATNGNTGGNGTLGGGGGGGGGGAQGDTAGIGGTGGPGGNGALTLFWVK